MSRIQMPPPPDLGAAEPGNRRHWPRYTLPETESFTVTARPNPHGGTGACTIEDISLGGARLRMEGLVPGDQELRIEHPRLGHAYVRRCWEAKNQLGVAFDHSEPSLAFIAGCLAEGVEAGDRTTAG